jgi:hypothetical protein
MTILPLDQWSTDQKEAMLREIVGILAGQIADAEDGAEHDSFQDSDSIMSQATIQGLIRD